MPRRQATRPASGATDRESLDPRELGGGGDLLYLRYLDTGCEADAHFLQQRRVSEDRNRVFYERS